MTDYQVYLLVFAILLVAGAVATDSILKILALTVALAAFISAAIVYGDSS